MSYPAMGPHTPAFSQPSCPPAQVMSRRSLLWLCPLQTRASQVSLAKMSHMGGRHGQGKAFTQQKSSKQSKWAQCHFLTPARQQEAWEIHQTLNFMRITHRRNFLELRVGAPPMLQMSGKGGGLRPS